MPIDPLLLATGTTEAAFCVAGLVLLWKRVLSPAARQAGPQASALRPWDASLLELGMLVWVVIVTGFALQVGLTSLLSALKVEGLKATIIASFGFQGGMLLGCLGFASYSDAGKDYAFPKAGFIKGGLATFLIVLPLVFGLGAVWHWLLNLCGVDVNQQELVDLFRKAGSPWLVGGLVFLAVVVAPVTEELIFRAGLFRFLRTRTPRWVALVLPAVLFGALHMNLASFPQLVLLGIVFSLAFERTGNIGVSMLGHALFNLNTIVMILLGIDS
jgi:membrane protease YdiL (CAAX protease family)